MKPTETRDEERYTLEIIASSYEARSEQEEAIWRVFIDIFVKNHDWHDCFTFEEVMSAYHAFLQAQLDTAKASLLLDC